MLLYVLEMAPTEQHIAKQCYAIGQPLPDRIANAPELISGLEMYLQAFFDLDSERSHSMGLTRIPWSSIKDYSLAFDLSVRQTEDLFYYIRAMDGANLQYLEERLSKS